MLSQVDTVLGSFTTRFPAWRRERTTNIRIAANKVDGTVIKPGEDFSYNKIVGPRSKEFGFKDAPIFVRGKLVPGTGGGICQLSSTIYNAVLLSNLKIVERSNHSSTVPYVSLGRDATVAYGLLDFRFRNSTSTPIYISSRMSGSYLHVDIYGASKDKTDVDVVVEKKGALKANVYRVVKQDGKIISRELVSRDRYRPAEPMVEAPKPKPRPQTVGSTPAQRT
jgi:vancomycin resistance protein YoaR